MNAEWLFAPIKELLLNFMNIFEIILDVAY